VPPPVLSKVLANARARDRPRSLWKETVDGISVRKNKGDGGCRLRGGEIESRQRIKISVSGNLGG
jgi:hypothetical protein